MNGKLREDEPKEPGGDQQYDPNDPIAEALKAFWRWFRTEEKERVAIAVNGSLVVVGIVAAIVYFLQLLVMQQSISVNQEIARADRRAWVGITSVSPVKFERDDARKMFYLTVDFVLKNFGRSPAENVRIFPSLITYRPDPPPCAEYENPFFRGDVIFPGDTRKFEGWGMVIPFKDVQDVASKQQAGIVILQVVGCITYGATGEATHHTPISYIVAPKSPAKFPFITMQTKEIPGSDLMLEPYSLKVGPID